MQRQVIYFNRATARGESIPVNVIVDEYAMVFVNGLLRTEGSDYIAEVNLKMSLIIQVETGDVLQIINHQHTEAL